MKRQLRHRKLQPTKDLFDSLARNAIDFLRKSVLELQKHPKYSVIHFYMALELFLKARLLLEHWALVVSKVEKSSIQSFEGGDFISVSLDECLQRLENIAGESLLKHEHECFRTIRDHRNKLVHFFHPNYQPPIGKKILAQIVSEQSKAWFYLHRLLTSKWGSHFIRYRKQIAALQKLVRRNQHFLSSKIRAITPEIEADQKRGISFVVCSACGYESARIDKIDDPLFERKCLVCDWSSHFLKIRCPKCGAPVTIESEEGGECVNCETTIGMQYLLEKLGPRSDPKEESSIARCCECENFQPSVIPFGEDEYLCLNCLTLHAEVGQCGWCGELITGDTIIHFGHGLLLVSRT